MDQRERVDDKEEALRACVEDRLVNFWTALPCIVQSFNPAKGTCVLQAAVQAQVRQSDGTTKWVDLPPLVDVPVVFPAGGAFILCFPITAGDEALAVFGSRCIDNWWLQGGAKNTQAEFRFGDLSDAFAFVGPRSQPRNLVPPTVGGAGPSATACQLRTIDGSAYIELTSDGKVNIDAPGGVHITGTLGATGEITALGTHTVSAHTHSDPQGGTSGAANG